MKPFIRVGLEIETMLHRQAKAKASLKGVTITAYVLDLVRQDLEKFLKPEPIAKK